MCIVGLKHGDLYGCGGVPFDVDEFYEVHQNGDSRKRQIPNKPWVTTNNIFLYLVY